MTKKLILLIALVFLSTGISQAEEYDFRFDEATELEKDTTLSGTVYIKDYISVPKGITLTIKPGAVMKFENPGFCDDGNVNFSISVSGKIIAIGTKEEPIKFTSASKKEISSFGELFLNESEGSALENCDFQYSHWCLHIHDSDITVKNCSFRDSFGGIRFKGDLTAEDNEFINNDTSLRFWMGSPKITSNTFKDVGTAIFLREKVKDPIIKGNAFSGVKDYFIKLGEMQDTDVTASDNDFGNSDKKALGEKLYDKDDDEYLGKIILN